MKKVLTCQECHVEIESGEFCKLCAPYMEESKLEVSMKDLNVFEIAELESLLAKEESMYSDLGNQWDMVEDHIRTHGTDIEFDDNGNELGAELVLNKPATGVYYPSEQAEFDADITAGSWLSPAALMVHASELESVYVKDYNDDYIQLVHYYPNVLTRKNTITEEQAFDNLFSALDKLSKVTTREELFSLSKEIYSAQTATDYSKMYYFPKSGSRAFWDAYNAKKEELGIVTTKTEVDMKKFYDQLDACKTSKDFEAVRKAVFDAPYCAEKSAFWDVYRAKKQSYYAVLAENRAKTFKEVVSLINEYNSTSMLVKVNEAIYQAYLPIEVKRVLWKKVGLKIKTGSVDIDVDKGIAYMESLFNKAA